MLILFEIFTVWGRTIIAVMNGFGVIGLVDKPFYNIHLDIEGFTKNMYGVIAGPAYTIVFAICLLFTGQIADKFNRKNIILLAILG